MPPRPSACCRTVFSSSHRSASASIAAAFSMMRSRSTRVSPSRPAAPRTSARASRRSAPPTGSARSAASSRSSPARSCSRSAVDRSTICARAERLPSQERSLSSSTASTIGRWLPALARTSSSRRSSARCSTAPVLVARSSASPPERWRIPPAAELPPKMLSQRLGVAIRRGSRSGSMLPLDGVDGAPGAQGLLSTCAVPAAVARPVVLFTPETHLLDVSPRFRGARRVVAAAGPLPPAGRLGLPLLKQLLPSRSPKPERRPSTTAGSRGRAATRWPAAAATSATRPSKRRRGRWSASTSGPGRGEQDRGPVAGGHAQPRVPAPRRHERRRGDVGRHHDHAEAPLDEQARHGAECAAAHLDGHAVGGRPGLPAPRAGGPMPCESAPRFHERSPSGRRARRPRRVGPGSPRAPLSCGRGNRRPRHAGSREGSGDRGRAATRGRGVGGEGRQRDLRR